MRYFANATPSAVPFMVTNLSFVSDDLSSIFVKLIIAPVICLQVKTSIKNSLSNRWKKHYLVPKKLKQTLFPKLSYYAVWKYYQQCHLEPSFLGWWNSVVFHERRDSNLVILLNEIILVKNSSIHYKLQMRWIYKQ